LAEAVCVDPKQVDAVWDRVSPWVKRAMERGDLGTFWDIELDVLDGKALLWLAWDGELKGCAITQITKTEKSKVCLIVACGGEKAKEWVHLIGKIEIYARDEGCDAVRILGRKGWLRVLKDYSAPKLVLEKRL
jgi:hypothetical protein